MTLFNVARRAGAQQQAVSMCGPPLGLASASSMYGDIELMHHSITRQMPACAAEGQAGAPEDVVPQHALDDSLRCACCGAGIHAVGRPHIQLACTQHAHQQSALQSGRNWERLPCHCLPCALHASSAYSVLEVFSLMSS